MKKILLMAALACIGFTAKAQDVLNSANCDVELRPFCLNITTCVISYPTPSVWTNAPFGPTPLPSASCGAGTVVGYEVRYAMNTGCSSNPSVLLIDAGMTPPPCGFFQPVTLGPCPDCTSSPDGFTVDFTNGVMHVYP